MNDLEIDLNDYQIYRTKITIFSFNLSSIENTYKVG